MLGFVQNWFGPKLNPIGIDFGSDALRLAQVQVVDGEHKLVAAASADVPAHVRKDPAARVQFFAETVRDLVAQGNFKGRRVMLNLPAAHMHIQHLRVPKLSDDELRKALPFECRGKLPVDPGHCLLRHLVAGEIYTDNDPKLEVIVMAAARELVNNLLAAATRAKLDVVGMGVEPKVLVDCFNHVYRRKADADATNAFVDIGSTGTRVVISRGPQILFARTIPVGGDAFTRATADAMKLSFDDAKLLRIRLANLTPAAMPPAASIDRRTAAIATCDEAAATEEVVTTSAAVAAGPAENSFALLDAAMARARKQADEAPAATTATAPRLAGFEPSVAPRPDANPADERELLKKVDQACRDEANRLVEEIDLCRRYYESTFPGKPVDRLLFVGGEARQRALCMHVARELGTAAQVADPLVRMNKTSEVGIESGIDRRQPQPAWAIAVGLSLGSAVPQPTPAQG
ncbi:MAG TPA: pilus assembly protein PilM [Tepidisphaeraceae bacterium]|nr:pilus assembly protein PilM [Tepidisphaeraceae bacterium]